MFLFDLKINLNVFNNIELYDHLQKDIDYKFF